MVHLQNNECKRTCSSVLPIPMALLKLATVSLTFIMLCLTVLLQLVLEFIFRCLLSTMGARGIIVGQVPMRSLDFFFFHFT
jgi:hypothetical protein